MATHPNRGKKPRPVRHLEAAGQLYPDAWSQIETFRTGRGKDLPDWPDWCFLPMAAWYAIVSADAQVDQLSSLLIPDVARLAALGAWRYTQGIYQLDPDLFTAVAQTTVTGDIPVEAIMHMPEWCLYIETPGMYWLDNIMHGFFAHLEFDIKTKRTELRLLIDTDDELAPVPLHLGKHTLTEAVDRAIAVSKKYAAKKGVIIDDNVEAIAKSLHPMMSLLLYVCSHAVDYPDQHRPANPTAKRTRRHGWRLFPAAKPRRWKLGKKTGKTIREQLNNRKKSNSHSKAPHIRRAHWHGYWVGPRDSTDRKFELKWLPPMVVAAE